MDATVSRDPGGTVRLPSTTERASWTALAGFGYFGLFWGTWGALLPGVQRAADVDDGELGTALLCVGLGALPAMALAGRVVDRIGVRAAPPAALAMGLASALVGQAHGAWGLAGALLVLGACSGAYDVVVNAAGVQVEQERGGPFLALVHATFSASVIAGAFGGGVLRAAGVAPGVVLAGVGAVGVVLASVLGPLRADATRPAAAGTAEDTTTSTARRAVGALPVAALVVVGLLVAASYLIENAHQSWSAVALERFTGAGPAMAAGGPIVFAAATACARFGLQLLGTRVGATTTVACGALVAAGGTALAASSSTVPSALAGVALAGAGTAVMAPTLLGVAGRISPPSRRGSVVFAVTAIGYLGFLAGPAIVGLVAEGWSLRVALGVVAAVAGALAVAAPVVRRIERRARQPARRQAAVGPQDG
jgi:MFS family permease